MPDNAPKPEPAAAPPAPAKPHDETVQGGCYITGGRPGPDGKHYGGKVTNAEGEVLNEFRNNEVNTGQPKAKPKEGEPAAPLKHDDGPAKAPEPKPAGKPEGK